MNNSKQIQFIGTTPDEFLNDLDNRIEIKLNHFKKSLNRTNYDQLMTRKEVAKYLNISLTTLWKHTKDGKLKSVGIGRRLYYKRSEIERALVEL